MSDMTSITADIQTARVFEWRRGFNTIYLLDLGVKLGLRPTWTMFLRTPAIRVISAVI